MSEIARQPRENLALDNLAQRINEEHRAFKAAVESALERGIRCGELAAIKLAPGMQGRVRIAESDLKAFLESRRKNTRG